MVVLRVAVSRPGEQTRAHPPVQPPKDFTELVRLGCEEFVLKGIGLPLPAYVFHAVKLSLLVLGWMFFVSFTPGLGSPFTFLSLIHI